jgi:hypothetical protein
LEVSHLRQRYGDPISAITRPLNEEDFSLGQISSSLYDPFEEVGFREEVGRVVFYCEGNTLIVFDVGCVK